MRAFAEMLRGGDRRSIGRSDAVAAAVRRRPRRAVELWACLHHADPLVRMRAADALEKLTRVAPASLRRHKKALLDCSYDDGTAEVRWHLLTMVSRLTLRADEAKAALTRMSHSLRADPSRIVKVSALQGAADICARHRQLHPVFRRMLSRALTSPWPSVRARARRLLAATA